MWANVVGSKGSVKKCAKYKVVIFVQFNGCSQRDKIKED
jgi:hypothetical protein